jgi:hypothetical protein
MTTIVAQIAPQRSTQYSEIASALAPHELALSPLGGQISAIEPCTLGGQSYLKFELAAEPGEKLVRELGTLAMTSAFFLYFDQLGEYAGPLLRPLETGFTPFMSQDFVTARRYKGKTNEMFTHFLCNVARFSSAFAHRPWGSLRVLDPLAGGGTTLFVALMLGAEAAGIERNAKDVQTTAAFIKRYTREQGISCKAKEERLKTLGRRWWFTLGKEQQKRCLLVKGEAAQAVELTNGFKQPHLIVTDLPYGIQHTGALSDLLTEALPAWESLLPEGGALAMSWESTRFPRETMIDVVAGASNITVLNTPPYDALAHRVDRVIKQRDVIVAHKQP